MEEIFVIEFGGVQTVGENTPGKSAYQEWQAAGHTGTEIDFLNSLKGEPGKVDPSAYYNKQQVDDALAGKAGSGHAHQLGDITGLSEVLADLQAQIAELSGSAPAPEALTITAGVDKVINLPTNQVTLVGQAQTGIATSWGWQRLSGPLNSGTNFDVTLPNYNPARTFTIHPNADGRAVLNAAGGYRAGDRILLAGDFLAVSVVGLIGDPENPIYIQNVPGQVTTIGDEAWSGGSWSEAIKFEGCKYIRFWGTDLQSLVVTGSTSTTEVGGLQVRTAYKNISVAMYTDNIRIAFVTVKNGGTGIWAKKEVDINDANSYGDNKLENLQVDNVIIQDWYNEAMYIGHTADWWDTTGMAGGGLGKPYYYKPGVADPDPAIFKRPIRWKGVKLFNNYIHDGRGDAIQCANSDGVEIANNEVHNWATGHVWTDNGGNIIGAITDVKVVNNYIHDGWGDCIQAYVKGACLIENNLLVNGGNEGISIRTTNNAVVTVRKNTIVNMASSCIRINGYYQGTVASDPAQAAHIIDQNILAKPKSTSQYIYKENGAKATEGSGNAANLKQLDLSGLDVNNYFLPASSLAGFRKGSTVVGVAGTPGATIATPDQRQTLVTALAAGEHIFEVTAKRADGTPAVAQVKVTVAAASVVGVPNAVAGSAQTTTATTITLDGSASTSPNGPITGWSWTRQSGPDQGAILNPDAAITQVFGLAVGSYVFLLQVADGQGQTDTAAVQVVIQNPVVGTSQFFSDGGAGWGDNVYDTATGRKVLVYLPAGYDPTRAKKYGAEINLHGLGERGTDINKLKTAGLPKLVAAGQESENVIIFPQLDLDGLGSWTPEKIKKAYDYLVAYCNVDTNRIAGSGLSEGSNGMIKFMVNYPGLISAYAISNTPENIANANTALLKDIPGIWVAATGDAYGFANTTTPVNGLIAAGGLFPPKLRVNYGGIHDERTWNDKLFNKSTAGFNYETSLFALANLNRETQAGNFVTRAQTTQDYNDYLEARRVVLQLPAGAAKTQLLANLDALLIAITPGGTRRLLISLGDATKPADGNYTQITSTANGTTTPLIDVAGAATGLSFRSVATQWDSVMPGLIGSYFGLPASVYSQGRRVYGTGNDWRIAGVNPAMKYDIRIFHCEKTEANNVQYGFKATIGGQQLVTEDHHYNTMKTLDWYNIIPAGVEITLSPIGANTPNPNEGVMIAILITEKTV